MEEEKDDNSKKTPDPSKQNTIERLIKLDQKNSALSPFNKKNRRRILVRDQSLNSDFSWTPNKVENSLYVFWSHIDQYYFKSLKEDDHEVMDYLVESLVLMEKEQATPKYSDFEAYEAFQSIISPEYKKLIADQALAKLDYANLKQKYLSSTMKPPQKKGKGSKSSKKLEPFEYDTARLKSAKSKGKLKGFLTEESNQIEEFLETIEDKDSGKADEIEKEIEKVIKDQTKANTHNINKLLDLKKKAVKLEQDHQKIVNIQEILNSTPNRPLVRAKWGRKSPEKVRTKGADQAEAARSNMVDYLRSTIVKLENQQAAESIKYVIDCKKPLSSGDKYKFCVIFDEAIRNSETWIDEPTLDHLDKLREQSLFKTYKIPQKIYYSINSSNLAGFQYCNQVVENKIANVKEKPWKELIKKGFVEGLKGFTKEELYLKSREFGLCHHCKYLFPEEFLVRCTYRTSELKPPSLTPEYLNPLATHGNIPKRSIWNNRRSISSLYQKKNGELVCLRAFCRVCLKQNLGLKIPEVLNKANWVCPFCDGTCNCSRCLRSDHINKLISLYSIIGGDMGAIKQSSCLEKYINHFATEDSSLKTPPKFSYYALKPTGRLKEKKQNQEVKGKIQEYKGTLEQYRCLKDMRIKLERMRIICSQISKKESLSRLEVSKNSAAKNGKMAKNNTKKEKDQKDHKEERPDLDEFEPFLSKQLKAMTGTLKISITKAKNLLQKSRKKGMEEEDSDSDSDSGTPSRKKGLSKLADKAAKRSYIRRTIQSSKVKSKGKVGRPRKGTGKVGRPRKNPVGTGKVGRPRKTTGKVGRPPKDAGSRKVGRPRKTPGKVGRPPKSAASAARKVGRPKKVKSTGTGRVGRPPKSATIRKVGRPKGSKNKPKVAEMEEFVVENEDGMEIEDDDRDYETEYSGEMSEEREFESEDDQEMDVEEEESGTESDENVEEEEDEDEDEDEGGSGSSGFVTEEEGSSIDEEEEDGSGSGSDNFSEESEDISVSAPKRIIEAKQKKKSVPKTKPKSKSKGKGRVTNNKVTKSNVRGRGPGGRFVRSSGNPNEPSDQDDEEIEEEEDEEEEEDGSSEDGSENESQSESGSGSEEEEDDEDEEEDEEDGEERKRFRLKKELQKILTHQPEEQFEVFKFSPTGKRVTRSAYGQPNSRKVKTPRYPSLLKRSKR